MADKLLSDEEIQKLLESKVELVKQKMHIINTSAVMAFYNMAGPGSYSRTGSFFNFDKEPEEEKKGKSVLLTYTYSAGDVSVNHWEAPWRVGYIGDPVMAFDTGFMHGFHGGPRPTGIGGWTWDRTSQTESVLDVIRAGISAL